MLTDRDGMSKLYRGPSIDASYHVSDHLAKRFQRRRCFEIDPGSLIAIIILAVLLAVVVVVFIFYFVLFQEV